MRAFAFALFAATAAALATGAPSDLPASVPRSIDEFRVKHPYSRRATHASRSVVTLRASTSDTDDVADEFLNALKRANHGGTLRLDSGNTYVIGKPLDLTFLDDIHV